MNLAPVIAHAAKYAQGILAPLGDPAGVGEFTIAGDTTTYVGVLNEFDATDPLDPTGIKNLRYLTIEALRTQFSSAPSASPRKTLTAKGRTWVIQSTTDHPNFYKFTCRPA